MAQVSFETYKGKAIYPWLNKADIEFDPEGVYKTGLLVPADQAKHIVDMCKQVASDELGGKKAATAKMPWKQDAETGELLLNVKSKFVPVFYDAEGARIPENKQPKLHGGSIIRVGGTITAYDRNGNHGVSLKLSKVQVIVPVERSDDAGGFSAVEGGGFTLAESDDDASEKEEGFSADF